MRFHCANVLMVLRICAVVYLDRASFFCDQVLQTFSLVFKCERRPSCLLVNPGLLLVVVIDKKMFF